MTDIIEQTTPEAAPVEAPSQLTPANEPDEFSRLLQEYESQASTPAPEPAATDEPVADGANDPNATSNELDQLLANYDPRLAQLEGELAGVRSEADQLRAEAHRQQEWAEFQSYAKSLQDDLPSWVPEDYATLKLAALAHDQTVAQAFDYRNVDKAAAKAELMKAQLVLSAFQRANNNEGIGKVQEYIGKLNVAINSQAILRQARLNILNEANKLPPPIDQAATELKAEIAWNMKSQGKKIAEPPPNFGRMTDQEFRDWKLSNLGWT